MEAGFFPPPRTDEKNYRDEKRTDLHPGIGALVFGRAIHALARIGDEFWFDPIEKGVQEDRSLPQGEYNLNFDMEETEKEMKKLAVLPVFRCLNTLEKNVEKCIIYTNFNSSHIVFQLFCKHGVVKTHNLAFQESEPLQAVFAKHLCPNRLKIQTRQLSDILIHFPTYQDEITLAVTPVKVCFKTYVEDEMDFAKTMHTEIHLRPEEFEYFQVGVDSEVTFCLKELKGLLAFAEAISAPVSVHFDVSGKPVAFSIEDVVIEASFVLATLADTENMTSSHYSPYPVQDQKRSPALERSNKDIISNRNLKDTETATTDNCTIMGKVVPSDPEYDKFHSLFFGAVSSKEKDIIHVFHSLATESDTEEDSGNGEISQTF